MKCPKCGGPLKPLLCSDIPTLSVQCYHCNSKYSVSITTAVSTNATYTVHGVYKQKQDVPQAFQDAFGEGELEI